MNTIVLNSPTIQLLLTDGCDIIRIEFDGPSPIYPFDSRPVLELKAAHDMGDQWIRDVFQTDDFEIINTRLK